MKSNILIVDDSYANIDILNELLGDEYDVLVATNAQDALELAKKEIPQLILLDIVMPDMDGYEVCKILHKEAKTKYIPVIFITAKTDELSIEKAYDVGGVDYITKPFKPKELLAKVKKELKMQELIVSLDDLNKNLEQRVKTEVQKNQEKEKQMLNQSRMAQMGEMISMIAHQWRQPLGAISATNINLKMRLELNTFDLQKQEGREECQKFVFKKLDEVNYFVKNLTSTIDDFRNFYKPNKKSVSMQLECVIAKALTIIEASLLSDNIEIIKNYDDGIKIELYDNEMMQVILNLLKNAQDNFKEKNIKNPKIQITIKDKTIIICDNGGGIPTHIIGNIFDPYFSTKDEKKGSGLGLYMSKTIVEEHHKGSLDVKNIDDGVCFSIVL